jgi:hypothetical protein
LNTLTLKIYLQHAVLLQGLSFSQSVPEHESHVDCDAVSLIEWYPSFPNIVVSSSSKVTRLASEDESTMVF